MRPNRDYHPSGYDEWTSEGRLAARAGKPRELPHRDSPYEFAYGFPAICWFHGYDAEKVAPVFLHDEGTEPEGRCGGEAYVGVRCRLTENHVGRCCSFGAE